MNRIGKNMRLTAAHSARSDFRRLFVELLKADAVSPAPELDVYVLDGFSLGIYFVEEEEALAQKEMMKAPWIEIVVDDLERTRTALAGMGLTPFEYQDRAHDYYQGPGGLVFRLAA